MSVYVDELRSHGPGLSFPASCHMMADTDEELEGMACFLRLLPRWRHGDHYDITEVKRSMAVTAEAVEVTERDLVELRKAKRQRPTADQGRKGK